MKIIECPRDAMQGLTQFIDTETKIRYLNELLRVGFDTIDFGSFVSAKVIPQMEDTPRVLERLHWEQSRSKLLAIVANARGAREAAAFEGISYLGFPLSISETFQKRNTNKSIEEALDTLEEIQHICNRSNKQLVVYISMAFGNPYNDPYDISLVTQFVDVLAALDCKIISLADTVGAASADDISILFTSLSKQYAAVEIGVHLHSNPSSAVEKIAAAYASGCKRLDGAIRGYGGCPMAKDDLVGNIATESILHYLEQKGLNTGINKEAFGRALKMADEIFPNH